MSKKQRNSQTENNKTKENKAFLDTIEKFFDYNIYLPARTLYFGSEDIDFDFNEAGVDYKSVKRAVKGLFVLNSINDKPIRFILNSPGGYWYHGMALYDAIKYSRSPVTVIAIGQCMSMGTIILQAAVKRVLAPNCTLMIHDGYDGFYGKSKDFEAWAEHAKIIRDKMYKIYYEKMVKKNKRIKLKDIEAMCNNDKIFGSREAVKMGLADEVIKEPVK